MLPAKESGEISSETLGIELERNWEKTCMKLLNLTTVNFAYSTIMLIICINNIFKKSNKEQKEKRSLSSSYLFMKLSKDITMSFLPRNQKPQLVQ